MKLKPQGAKWDNRIIGNGVARAGDFLANEANWRIHAQHQQQALGGVLSEVGWVQSVIVNKRLSELWGRNRNVETLVDGHLRVSLALSRSEDTEVPVVYVDLDPAEEALILASFDPLSALAVADKEQLDSLLREIQSGDAAVQAMLGKLAADVGITKFDPDAEWQGMPEFEQEAVAFQSIHVHCKTEKDLEAFALAIGRTSTGKIPTSIWYAADES